MRETDRTADAAAVWGVKKGADWHISASSQRPFGCSSYQRKEASGRCTPLLDCYTGSRDSEGRAPEHAHTHLTYKRVHRFTKNTNLCTQHAHAIKNQAHQQRHSRYSVSPGCQSYCCLHLACGWWSWMEQRCLIDCLSLLSTDPPVSHHLSLTAQTEKHLPWLDTVTRLKHGVRMMVRYWLQEWNAGIGLYNDDHSKIDKNEMKSTAAMLKCFVYLYAMQMSFIRHSPIINKWKNIFYFILVPVLWSINHHHH